MSKEAKAKNEKPFKKMYRNTYSSSMINTLLQVDDADLSDCYNVNDADENISGEVENIKPNNNSENLLSTVLQSEPKVTSDEFTKPSDNSQSDPNVTSNTLTKLLDNAENSLLVDLGYGVKIRQSILEKKIRKKNERHLLLDLLNALYTKADFASCSRSGKRVNLSKQQSPNWIQTSKKL
ncbi:hypothetical protein ACS0PU_012002 [Formica fusca]